LLSREQVCLSALVVMFELELITQVAICKPQPAIMLLLTVLACLTRCRLAYGLITSNAVLELDVESSCVSCCCLRGSVLIRLRANSDASNPPIYPYIVCDVVTGVLLIWSRFGSSGLILSECVPDDTGRHDDVERDHCTQPSGACSTQA